MIIIMIIINAGQHADLNYHHLLFYKGNNPLPREQVEQD